MKLTLLAIGKLKNGPEHSLVERYIQRLPHSGGVVEFDSRKGDALSKQVDEQRFFTQFMSDKASAGAKLVLLDKTGRDIASEGLAELIGNWRDEGIPQCCFAIGGADGHLPELRRRADRVISFGQAVWPHKLCRVMLAEQLYRAEMIRIGHPYHEGH